MKLDKRFITHLNGRRYCHFWLIPSIETDYEHFKTKDFGEFQWLHIYFSWLFWSLDVELTIEDENNDD